MHAREIEWSEFERKLSALVSDVAEKNSAVPDSYTVQRLFVTGSLAYGGGVESKSDLDILIGGQSQSTAFAHGEVEAYLHQRTDQLASVVNLPVSTVHVVEVCSAERAPHRAMELQHHGRELAQRYNKDDAPEMKIFDVQQRKSITNARAAVLQTE